MSTTISRCRQSMRSRRTRVRQQQVLRAHHRAVTPTSGDRYLMALNVSPMP